MSEAELAKPSVSWFSTKIVTPIMRKVDRLMILIVIDCTLGGFTRNIVA
jgi:hypothetical protein